MARYRPLLLKAFLVGAAYALLDLLCVVPAIRLPFLAEAVWLPSGFLFAMLMRFPRRQWVVVILPVVLAAGWVNLSQNWSPVGAIAFALTDPLEVLLGAWVATSLLKGRPMDLGRIPDALILGLAGLLNGLVAGPAGLLAARVAHAPFEGTFIGAIWSASVLLAHLFITPLFLAWPREKPGRLVLLGESLLWTAAGVAVTRWGLHTATPDAAMKLLVFLPFPMMVGAAIRTGSWGASLALACVSFTALAEGAHGHAPIPMTGLAPDRALFWFQLFLATEATSILVLSCASDAQRRTEGSLLESESRYRHLVEQFPDAILLHDGSRIRYANPAAVALLGGGSPGGLVGDPVGAFLAGGDGNPEPGPATAPGAQTSFQERTVRGLDGREIPVEVTRIDITLADRTDLTLNVFRDLTQRRLAESALQRAEEGFRQLFDLAPFPLVLSTLGEDRLLRVNPLARNLLELDGGDPGTMLPTRSLYVREEARQGLLDQVRSAGRVDGVEVELLTPTGRLLRVLVSAARVGYGGEEALLSGLVDVTLRMKTEEATRQAQKLESLGLLAGGIAHDFNNLLTALQGNLDLARLAIKEQRPADRNFEAMEATLRRAADLARQMLAYAGQARFEIRPLDANAALRELAVLLSASMSKKIQLHFDLEEGLPLLEGDPVQIQQVFLNLAINACDAIGDRAGDITLQTRLDQGLEAGPSPDPGRRGPSVLVKVMDTGSGMSPEVCTRIFDPFFTTKTTGRGLGLSTMLGILRSHGAEVSVESEPGKGSCFTLRFPAPRVVHPSVPSSVPAAAGPIAAARLGGVALVVDDEASILATARAQLSQMGFEVVEASDGLQALQAVEAHREDLRIVVLDLTMPRMDGAEALEGIRRIRPDLPVILSSGFDPGHRTPELLKQPGIWFLPKPYSLPELYHLVVRVLGA